MSRFDRKFRTHPRQPCPLWLAAQFVSRVAALAEEVAAIEFDERAMNEMLYALYGLSPEERNLVENERAHRNVVAASG